MTSGVKIGALAKRLGVSPSALRYYEEQGLVQAPRSGKGTRRYGSDEAERFAAILALARCGVAVKDMQDLAAIRPASATGDQASRAVSNHLERLRAAVEERRRAAEALLQDIEKAEQLVRQCFGCSVAPTRNDCKNCHVATGLGEARLLALVWDQEVEDPPPPEQ